MTQQPTVPPQNAAFLTRLRALIDNAGQTDRQISLAVTGSPDFIRDLFRRHGIPRGENLQALATALQTTTAYLLHGDDLTPEPAPQSSGTAQTPTPTMVASPMRDFNARQLPKDVPVLGSVLGCTNGEIGEQAPVETHLVEMGDVADIVRRPPGLANVRDAYALYITGDSQYPKYEPGELIYVNPNRPASIGDDVVVQLIGEDDTVVTALIKRLRRRTAQGVVLEQFNPPREIIVPAARVRAIHRVMPLAELLGL